MSDTIIMYGAACFLIGMIIGAVAVVWGKR